MQAAPSPNDKSSQRSHVESRKNQHVVHACLLKFDDAIVFDEAAVAQQHRARQRLLLEARNEKAINGTQKPPACARQTFGKCQTGMIENRQKLIVAERALQMDALEREVSAFIEAAGITEIAHR